MGYTGRACLRAVRLVRFWLRTASYRNKGSDLVDPLTLFVVRRDGDGAVVGRAAVFKCGPATCSREHNREAFVFFVVAVVDQRDLDHARGLAVVAAKVGKPPRGKGGGSSGGASPVFP